MMLHLKIRQVDLFQEIIGQRHHFLFKVPDRISSSDHKKATENKIYEFRLPTPTIKNRHES